jgi:hypothetical protein
MILAEHTRNQRDLPCSRYFVKDDEFVRAIRGSRAGPALNPLKGSSVRLPLHGAYELKLAFDTGRRNCLGTVVLNPFRPVQPQMNATLAGLLVDHTVCSE